MRSGLAPCLALLVTGCLAAPEESDARTERRAANQPGDEIIVCGVRFATGAPVVPWFEDPGYDAYATVPRFNDEGPSGLRYRPGRNVADPDIAQRVATNGWTLGDLQESVDLFVLHYDVCGTSRTCFDVLHDRRQLSVHFLLDVDGTIYQTLDLVDQAWHARQANPRSIGIEIANIGAYAPDEESPLEEWYEDSPGGVYLRIPERFGDGGLRVRDFEGRPARRSRIVGEIQGEVWAQYDFTAEQYESLVKLTRTLARVFPRLALEAPRDAQGLVKTSVLSETEFEAYSGLLGHYHVSANKRDPGPAFDWERFLAEVRSPAM